MAEQPTRRRVQGCATVDGRHQAMKKAKVLVVDDAMLIRRMVTDVLAADPQIEVVGEAINGRVAMQKIPQLNPDLITLDIEMPEMDGISTLKEIRKTYPRLPVIMFSALTERGAADTLEALHHGASDYVTKPASTAGKAGAQQRIQEDLIPKIKSLCRLGPAQSGAAKKDAAAPAAYRPSMLRAVGPAITADVVAIAVSTGGPTALAEVLSHLPASFPAPILLVQHMPQMFTRFLAERLNGQTSLTVKEAVDGEPIQPGVVYVAPGDYHLTVKKATGGAVAVLDQDPPQHSHRPAADVLFKSIAATFGPRGLGVVLTGMGQDGLRGSEEITRAGGRILVQDEASSVVWEMGGLVVNAGIADAVVPLAQVAGELQRRTDRNSSDDRRAVAANAGTRS
jgi:two-component system, chemotaxis family, protein-glutamate methylesterase/glutaminase